MLANDGAHMTSRFQPVCLREQVADPGAREFEFSQDGETISGFVLHWRGRWYAYRNRCPHTGVSLNWLPHQFLDIGHEFVQCSLHGALFRPEDGFCVRGPCLGRSLETLPVVIHSDEVGIELGVSGKS
jgi:nitrite reductase/ring-hydroxylating ferredoxin subunit